MKIPGAMMLRRALLLASGSSLVPIRNRHRYLKRLGLAGLESPAMGHGIVFANPGSVTCGPGCFINNQVYFDAGPVRLGTGVFLGPRSMILTGDHPIGDPSRRAGDGSHNPVSIGDGSWVGAGAIILPGVTIHEGCVIGAGAVVVSDCEPHGVYAGVPARRIRDLRADSAHALAEGPER